MSARRLALLLIAAAVVGGLAWMLSMQDSGQGGAVDELLLPGLAENLNDIDEIVVTGSGAETIATLIRSDGRWRLADTGYAANIASLRKNLIELSEARIREEKTANPEFYERLGVTDVSEENATGVLLDISGGDYKTSILIGDTGIGDGGAYVRRPDEARSYLVDADLDLGKSRQDWLNTALLDIPSSRIRQVSIQHPDGELLTLSKASEEATQFTVEDMPESTSLSYDGVANPIGAALADLEFDGVIPTSSFDESGPPVLANFETFDGLLIEARTWETDGERRVQFSALMREPVAVEVEESAAESAAVSDETASPESTDMDAAGDTSAEIEATADSKIAETENIASEMAQINSRVADWVYTLPSFKSDQLVKRMSDLLATE